MTASLTRFLVLQGDILEDIALIENLEETKRTAVDIAEKVKQAKETELSIGKAREVYRPVATRGSLVYFLIDTLNALDRCYHYSMANFVFILRKGEHSCITVPCSTLALCFLVFLADTTGRHASRCCYLMQKPSAKISSVADLYVVQLYQLCNNHGNGHGSVLSHDWSDVMVAYMLSGHDYESCQNFLRLFVGMDQTPGSKDESQVAESQRLGEEVDVERRVQLLISFTTQVVFGYVAQVKLLLLCIWCDSLPYRQNYGVKQLMYSLASCRVCLSVTS